MAWLTANALLRQGRSWSGNERNRSFLNIGGGRPMANVSAVSGLDFLDDARGVAATDWDHDGDLDFWITNRTAPMVRFVRNESTTGSDQRNGSIAFKLQGVQCNRDAIGARLELTINRGKPETRIQTLAAGDAFLAQSSKWVHFGLGKTDGLSIESLAVRWPDGSRQTFTDLEPNKRYRIVQGGDEVEPVEIGARQLKLQPSGPMPQWSSAARVPIFSRLPMPKLSFTTFDGRKESVGGPGEKALLISLWANWCIPCLTELKEFASHADQLGREGIRVVALSIDQLEGQTGEKAARKIASGLGRKIQFGWATGEIMDTLETVQRSLIQGDRALPMPSSFLLGRDGRLHVLYKGPVSSAQLVQDVTIESVSDLAERVEIASPFAGRRRGTPKPIQSMQVALKFFEGGYRSQAKAYLRQLIRIGENREPGYEELQPGQLYYFLGALLEEDQDIAGAIHAFEKTVNFEPKNAKVHLNLAKLTAKAGQLEKSVAHIEALEKLAPGEAAQLRMSIAQQLYKMGRHKEAAENMRAVLRHNPRQMTAASNLAWILATNRNADVRDGAEAVKWAMVLVNSTGQKDPRALDTLAAAYAEIGEFENAVKASNAAIAVATKLKQQTLLPELRSRLLNFKQGKPWHQ